MIAMVLRTEIINLASFFIHDCESGNLSFDRFDFNFKDRTFMEQVDLTSLSEFEEN